MDQSSRCGTALKPQASRVTHDGVSDWSNHYFYFTAPWGWTLACASQYSASIR
jgi:hypothetical protein